MRSAVSADIERPVRRFGLRHALTALVLLCLLAYAAVTVWLMTQETRLVFRTDVARADTRPAFPYEQIDLPRADRARQFAWVMKSRLGVRPPPRSLRRARPKYREGQGSSLDKARDDSEPVEASGLGTQAQADEKEKDIWVLYLHGNASTIASRMNVSHFTRLRELGLNLLAPEYRGYHGLAGVPSEAGVRADARAAYDYLRTHERVPPERLVIFGWSLGAAVAVDLASQVDALAVILEGAPASLVDLGQRRYPMFPIRLIMRNPFEAISKVAGIRAPMLFLHSPDDAVVPFAEGRRLFEAAPSPKKFVEVQGGHIEASEVDRALFYSSIREFLQASLHSDSAVLRK